MRDLINDRINEGTLHQLTPLLGGACNRVLLLSEELHDLVVGPWDEGADAERLGRLRADLDSFIAGEVISVRKQPFSGGKYAKMVHLEPPQDEVWEIRSIDPRPGIRLFGSFCERDVFAALTWAFRADLGGPADPRWAVALRNCKAKWRNLFGPYKPFCGGSLNDYLSRCALV